TIPRRGVACALSPDGGRGLRCRRRARTRCGTDGGRQRPKLVLAPWCGHRPSPSLVGEIGGQIVASVSVFDKTTGISTIANMDPYTGPITYLQDQYINITPDNIAVGTQAPNVFLRSGSGEDALQVSSGQNVIDGGTGAPA